MWTPLVYLLIARTTGRVIAQVIASAIFPVVSVIILKLDDNPHDYLLIILRQLLNALGHMAIMSEGVLGF